MSSLPYVWAHIWGILQISVEGAVTVVKHIVDSHDASGLNTGRQEVLYGTHNGVLGQLFLDHQTARQGWQMKSVVHKGDSACMLHIQTCPWFTANLNVP